MFAWKQWSFFVPSFQAMSRDWIYYFYFVVSRLVVKRNCEPTVARRGVYWFRNLATVSYGSQRISFLSWEFYFCWSFAWSPGDFLFFVPGGYIPTTPKNEKKRGLPSDQWIQIKERKGRWKDVHSLPMASNFQEFWCPKGSHCYQVLAKEKKKDSEH